MLDRNQTMNLSESANSSRLESPFSHISWDDATWILTSSFVIFTMQSGFGLLESGCVSLKNEVNIMIKNVVDVVFGGLTFWMLGFGFAFGEDPKYSNPFCGWGSFFTEASDKDMGWLYSLFFFQMSFATTSTTIVSGCMAERTKLSAYMLFSLLNTFVYCFPAHWIWAGNGWLKQLGVVDVAGAGPVHLVGGVTGLVATIMIGPRYNRFDEDGKSSLTMGCPTNSLLGMFMLWWGWLGFNCGSTYGISQGRWKIAARAAVTTLCSSMAGGMSGLAISFIVKKRKFDVGFMINSILGSLVSVTGLCALVNPWESLIIGAVGGVIAVTGTMLLEKIKVDDPAGVIPVHLMAAIWGLLSTGLFPDQEDILSLTEGRRGLFKGGGFYLLGVQTLAVVALTAWSALISFLILKAIDITVGLRVSLGDEILGADWCEHGIGDYSDGDEPITDGEKDKILCPSIFNIKKLKERKHSSGRRRSGGYGHRNSQEYENCHARRRASQLSGSKAENGSSGRVSSNRDVINSNSRWIYFTDESLQVVPNSNYGHPQELQTGDSNVLTSASGHLPKSVDTIRRHELRHAENAHAPSTLLSTSEMTTNRVITVESNSSKTHVSVHEENGKSSASYVNKAFD